MSTGSGRPKYLIPTVVAKQLGKSNLLNLLYNIDNSSEARAKILSLETSLNNRIAAHIQSMPLQTGKLKDFHTSPYVIMMHAKKRGYSTIKELENYILPAKEFSSMETSAGRMIEELLLPLYNWEIVPSRMHSVDSIIDGRKLENGVLHLATLKSGPRCLNDEMSENFADSIVNHCLTWASEAAVNDIDFVYGVLYGTPKQSNKKDWHILRKIKEKIPHNDLIINPDGQWQCKFQKKGITVTVTVRIGSDWWEYLGGNECLIILVLALIRACVIVKNQWAGENSSYTISDLSDIVSTSIVPADFNISLLQKQQLPWFFFFVKHFFDELKNE